MNIYQYLNLLCVSCYNQQFKMTILDLLTHFILLKHHIAILIMDTKPMIKINNKLKYFRIIINEINDTINICIPLNDIKSECQCSIH